MPSPFPGMNPWLEQEDIWNDFHQSCIPALRGALAKQLATDYVVKIEQRPYIHETPNGNGRYFARADVSVATDSHQPSSSSVGLMNAPARVMLPAMDAERSGYIEIRDARDRRLITVIELLSPANKRPGPDRRQYIDKRNEIIASGTNLVEIDLLRGGPRMPMDDLPHCDYCVLVSRYEDRPTAGIWPIALQEQLPSVPIPLRPPHPDASLDIQAILHEVYDAAEYERHIYEGDPDPALSDEEAAWAAEILNSASK